MRRAAKISVTALGAVAVASVVVIAGLTALVMQTPRGEVDTAYEQALSDQIEASREPTVEDKPRTVTTFEPQSTDVEVVIVPEGEIKVPEGQDPILFALNDYLDELDYVPAEAEFDGHQLEDGLLTVNLSESPSFGLASAQEQALFEGLLQTLRQFSEVEEVQFTVDGRKVESLGNLSLLEPMPVRR